MWEGESMITCCYSVKTTPTHLWIRATDCGLATIATISSMWSRSSRLPLPCSSQKWGESGIKTTVKLQWISWPISVKLLEPMITAFFGRETFHPHTFRAYNFTSYFSTHNRFNKPTGEIEKNPQIPTERVKNSWSSVFLYFPISAFPSDNQPEMYSSFSAHLEQAKNCLM